MIIRGYAGYGREPGTISPEMSSPTYSAPATSSGFKVMEAQLETPEMIPGSLLTLNTNLATRPTTVSDEAARKAADAAAAAQEAAMREAERAARSAEEALYEEKQRATRELAELQMQAAARGETDALIAKSAAGTTTQAAASTQAMLDAIAKEQQAQQLALQAQASTQPRVTPVPAAPLRLTSQTQETIYGPYDTGASTYKTEQTDFISLTPAPVVAAAPAKSNTWLILGAVALGAWLLLGRKKETPSGQ